VDAADGPAIIAYWSVPGCVIRIAILEAGVRSVARDCDIFVSRRLPPSPSVAVIFAADNLRFHSKGRDVNGVHGVILDDVGFPYRKTAGQPILDGLSANFAAGRITAFIGASGCGKTTLLANRGFLPPGEDGHSAQLR